MTPWIPRPIVLRLPIITAGGNEGPPPPSRHSPFTNETCLGPPYHMRGSHLRANSKDRGGRTPYEQFLRRVGADESRRPFTSALPTPSTGSHHRPPPLSVPPFPPLSPRRSSNSLAFTLLPPPACPQHRSTTSRTLDRLTMRKKSSLPTNSAPNRLLYSRSIPRSQYSNPHSARRFPSAPFMHVDPSMYIYIYVFPPRR